MSTAVIITVVVVGLIAVLWYFAAYNDFVRLRNLVAESWKQIDVELQRRHDLVPNVVATAENALTTALGRVHALAEQYPELGAVRNYAALQRELSDIEDRIAASRRLYNANVRALNTKVESVPAMVVASLHHVSTAEYFELSDPQPRAVVDLDRLFSDRAGR